MVVIERWWVGLWVHGCGLWVAGGVVVWWMNGGGKGGGGFDGRFGSFWFRSSESSEVPKFCIKGERVCGGVKSTGHWALGPGHYGIC